MNNFELLHEMMTNESKKTGDSGFEALVIDILDDNGIDASFKDDVLVVGSNNVKETKAILRKSTEVDLPKSIK